MKKHRLSFNLFETSEQAQKFCDAENKSGTAYKKTHRRAHFTPYTTGDGGRGFVAWYYV